MAGLDRNSQVALGWIYLALGGVLIVIWRASFYSPVLVLAVLALAFSVTSLVVGYRRPKRPPSDRVEQPAAPPED